MENKIKTDLQSFINKFKSYSNSDTAKLEQAYKFSQKMHQNQKRASGEDYFTHCVTVASILMDHKLDLATICAALLHDTIEDTPAKSDEIKKEFGSEISRMVEGVTKITSLSFNSTDEETAQNWRKMLVATARDIRVILIKLADRVHNMQTIGYLAKEKQIKKAKETLSLYAPLAQRLGMFNLKSELEDLSFEVILPKEFANLQKKMNQISGIRNETLQRFKKELNSHLSKMDLKYRVLARVKNLYSFYRKMQSQNLLFEEIEDSLGVRIITDTITNCYAILGVLHSIFKPVAGSFTDYIAIPKANMYQSIHTTVVSSVGDVIEVQIRTEEMHYKSEYGIAAHWRYKLGERTKDSHYDEKLNWVRQWLEWIRELTSPHEFLETFKTDMDLEQVFVFTPKGDVKPLPKGATVLDFAYAVHSEIGNKCSGAKINNKMVPINSVLKSGDFCEIITKKNQTPNQDWLKQVKTAGARSKIRKFLRENKK